MFGDNSFMESTEVSVDNIGRFSLPAILGAECGEKLVLLHSNTVDGAYELYNAIDLGKAMEEYKEKVSATNAECVRSCKQEAVGLRQAMEKCSEEAMSATSVEDLKNYMQKVINLGKAMEDCFEEAMSATNAECVRNCNQKAIDLGRGIVATAKVQSKSKIAFLKQFSGLEFVTLTGCGKFVLIEPTKKK